MKKLMRMSGILFLALVLALTTVVAVDTGKTVSAAAKAKTLKMKKKKVTISVGETKKLGVTVKPKKAKITWSTNKKKVATVNKKGQVKGIKTGTAKITAKSGKKKAVCTVKVQAAQGIKSVVVTNPKIIRVTLTKAASLKASDFAVKKKRDGKGAYNTALKVGTVTKINSKVYDINLSTDTALSEENRDDLNSVDNGDYVQVTVKKLKGANSAETVYFQSNYAINDYREALVGQKYEHTFSFSQGHKGYVSGIQVSGVPSGLTAKVYGDTVYVTGIPKEAKASVMTITGKDELGKKLTQKVYFYIGSDTVLLSYIRTEHRTILVNDNVTEYFEIETVGGSGGNTYTLTAGKNDFIENYGSSIYFQRYITDNNVKKYLNPGTYNVSYNVKDDKGHQSNGTLAVTGVKGVMISGRVMAADNTGISNAKVYASFNDDKHVYYDDYLETSVFSEGQEDYYSTAKKHAGDYSLVVYPNQIYDLRALERSSYVSMYAKTREVKGANISVDFKIPLYKVELKCGNEDLSDFEWYDPINYASYSGNILYLKKGNYKLTTSHGMYDYTATFTVSGNCTVNVSKTSNVTSSGTLSVNTPTTIAIPAEKKVYYAFTPSAAGDYTFRLDGLDEDGYTSVYYIDGTTGSELNYGYGSYDYDEGEVIDGSYHKKIDMVGLTAGKLYYIVINSDESYSSAKATITQSNTVNN